MAGYTSSAHPLFTDEDFSYRGELLKSSDGGGTWSSAFGSTIVDTIHNPTRAYMPAPGYVTSIAVDPNNSSRFYRSDDGGVFRTDDFGVNWVEKDKGAGNAVITDIKLAPDNSVLVTSMDSGLMRTTDGGQLYNMLIPNSTVGQNWPEVSGHFWAVEALGTKADWDGITENITGITNARPAVVTTSTAHGFTSGERVYLTGVGGMTQVNGNFYTVATPTPTTFQLSAVNSTDYGTYTSGGTAEVHRGVVVATSYCFACEKKHQILRSTNMGGPAVNTGTWSVLSGIGIPNTYMGFGVWGTGYARALALDPQAKGLTTGRVWVGLDGFNDTENGGIFLSTNGGQTFTRKTADNHTGCGGEGGCYRTLKGLAVNPTDQNNIIYAAFGASGIHYTLDGGTNWLDPKSGNQAYMNAIKFGPDGTAYASGDADGPIILRSTDKGATWTDIWHGIWLGHPIGGPADGLQIDPSNPNRLVISIVGYEGISPGHVFMSENAKADIPAFTDITGNLPSGSGMVACVFRNSEGTNGYLYCARFSGGVFKLNLAPSGGVGER
jgi:WD40 repeat protein